MAHNPAVKCTGGFRYILRDRTQTALTIFPYTLADQWKCGILPTGLVSAMLLIMITKITRIIIGLTLVNWTTRDVSYMLDCHFNYFHMTPLFTAYGKGKRRFAQMIVT